MKAASEVAVLVLYSRSEGCAKHVRVPARTLQAMVNIYSQVLLSSLVVSVWFGDVSYLSQAMLVLAELIVS